MARIDLPGEGSDLERVWSLSPDGMSSPVASSYASGAGLSAFSQSPVSASCTTAASESVPG